MLVADKSPAVPVGQAEHGQAAQPRDGLTSSEAQNRLKAVGPNAMPDVRVHPLRRALGKFWSPVPWMLEAAVALEALLGNTVEAVIIAGLLVFNAVLGFLQESRAEATLDALRSRLALKASVRRDGRWLTLPAAELVPGDLVKLSLGGVVAADVRLTEGEVLLDQSMLTGESAAVEAGVGKQVYAGALVRRGEASAEVTATGVRTKFGRTAELVGTAHVVSSQQKAVLRVVRNLGGFSLVVIVLIVVYAIVLRLPLDEIATLVLTAILASIPVALPATFTLAAALGARVLSRCGVLPTRLSAVDEAATIDVLCADKTGTLTANTLTVATTCAFAGHATSYVLGLAALASSEGGQDPVDAAVRVAAKGQDGAGLPKLRTFVPFDPATKMSEATCTGAGGAERVLKGAFDVVAAAAEPHATAAAQAAALETQGFRVLAVAAGSAASVELVGLLALSDPPRRDSAALVSELKSLGVRTIMVTGDAPATASTVAKAVGLEGKVCPPGPIPAVVSVGSFAVYAGVLPEAKYKLVKSLQQAGHSVGMCGDGANDAPALRQAQIGIAVSTATDVAKSSAGMVLTDPGLAGIVAAVREGRVTFQRIMIYTLNSITKKIVTLLLLAVGLLTTGHAILTPLLMVILMIAGDFLAMSLTTDNVQASIQPNVWRIGHLTVAGTVLGGCFLLFGIAVLATARYGFGYGIEALRSLTFLTLVFGSQANIYAIRGRHSLFGSRPSLWLAASSVADVVVASTLAIAGIAMAPLPVSIVAGVLVAAAGFGIVLALVKIPLLGRLRLA